jgi:hypothetical protein
VQLDVLQLGVLKAAAADLLAPSGETRDGECVAAWLPSAYQSAAIRPAACGTTLADTHKSANCLQTVPYAQALS